jgi:VanZ family protein
VIGWLTVIFLASDQPKASPARPGADEFRLNPSKLGHVIAYSVLGFLVAHALARSGVRRVGWWTFVFAALYAIGDETHQAFVPGRDPAVFDVLIDVASAPLGIVTWAGVNRLVRWGERREKRTSPSPGIRDTEPP